MFLKFSRTVEVCFCQRSYVITLPSAKLCEYIFLYVFILLLLYEYIYIYIYNIYIYISMKNITLLTMPLRKINWLLILINFGISRICVEHI